MKLRNALIVVLVAALSAYAWELTRRRAEYARRALANEMSLLKYDDYIGPNPEPDELLHKQYQDKMRKDHHMLMTKYKYAHDHPWIAVEPDSPPPDGPVVGPDSEKRKPETGTRLVLPGGPSSDE
jgi:hypothetical protein